MQRKKSRTTAAATAAAAADMHPPNTAIDNVFEDHNALLTLACVLRAGQMLANRCGASGLKDLFGQSGTLAPAIRPTQRTCPNLFARKS